MSRKRTYKGFVEAEIRNLLGKMGMKLKPTVKISVSDRGFRLSGRGARAFFLRALELVAMGQGEMTVPEAARLLKISRAGVHVAARRGHLRTRRVGHVALVDAGSLRTYMERTGRRLPPRKSMPQARPLVW